MFYKHMLTQPCSKSLKPDSFDKNPKALHRTGTCG